MKLFSKHSQKGFTIIEVMIVLAIAGVIIASVLVAVPQLQRNQRNSARKSILSRVKAEVDNFAGNNNGTYPANSEANVAGNFGSAAGDTASFRGRYLTGNNVDVKDPSTGSDMTFEVDAGSAASLAALPATGTVEYYSGAECSTDGSMVAKAGRFYALSVGLEGGSALCLDNE